jgi:hypothetical protein
MDKIRVGIDIDEILRAKWLQFDKYYAAEFGEEGIPQEPYVYDFFNEYKWETTIEQIKVLNEDAPENINPLDYQINEKTGESLADPFLFKKEVKEVTAKEKFNRFMYEDYLFEIHGSAQMMYKQMDIQVEKFFLKYQEQVEFILVSQENWFSIPPTLFFLSKIMSRFKSYKFFENKEEVWEGIDILITTDPEILKSKTPKNKKIIKISRPYNENIKNSEIKNELLQLEELNGNDDFEKLINYNKKK